MNEVSEHVERIAAAIADGDPVQWQRAELLASTERELSLVRELRQIASLRGAAPSASRALRLSSADVFIGIPVVLAVLQSLAAMTAVVAVGGLTLERLLPMQFAICLSFVSAAAILASEGVRGARSHRLAHVYFLVGAALARPLYRVAGAQSDLTWIDPLWRGIYPEAFLGIALWRFARDFPMLLRFGTYDRITVRVARAAGVVGAALFFVNVLIAYAPGIARFRWLAMWRRVDPSGHFWHLSYVFVGSAILTIALRYRHASADERSRTRWFGFALFAGAVPVIVVSALELLSPAFQALKVAGGTPRAVIDAVVLSGLLSIPISTSYIVIAHRVLGARIVAGRVLELALARRTLRAVAFILLAVLVAAAYAYRARPLTEIATSPWVVRIAGLLAAIGLGYRLRRRGLQAAGRLLASDVASSFEDRVVRIAGAIARGRTPRELSFHVAHEVWRLLGAAHVALLAGRPDGDFTPVDGASPALPRSSALVEILAADGASFIVQAEAALLRLVPESEIQWLRRAHVEMLVPIRSRGEELVGLLVLGPKHNGLAYTNHDAALLQAAAPSLAMALDSVRAADTVVDDVARECVRCGAVGDMERCACGGRARLARLPLVLAEKYRLERRVGEGAMGVVYVARDERLNRRVALKTLPAAAGGTGKAMFLEAQTMATSEHANLASVFDLLVWRSTPVLVEEFLPGGTLKDRLLAGPLPVEVALSIGADLADALAVLHGDHILHRDIKPSNIGFSRTLAPKLLDFGLARLTASPDGIREHGGRVEASALAGTPLYLSPEILSGDAPDEYMDLWALSVVVFETIAGGHPFAASSVEGVYQQICRGQAHLEAWQSGLRPELYDFMRRALALDRTIRPGSAQRLAAELRQLSQLF